MEIFDDPHVREIFDLSSGQPRLDPSRGWSNGLDQFGLEDLVRADYARRDRVEPTTWETAGDEIRDVVDNKLSDSVAPGWIKFGVWAVGAIGIVLMDEWQVRDRGLDFVAWAANAINKRPWMLEPQDGPFADVWRRATAILEHAGQSVSQSEEFRHLELAASEIAGLATVLDGLSVETAPLDARPFGAAFAVRYNETDRFVVVAFSSAGSSAAYLRAGVLHSVAAPRACSRKPRHLDPRRPSSTAATLVARGAH